MKQAHQKRKQYQSNFTEIQFSKLVRSIKEEPKIPMKNTWTLVLLLILLALGGAATAQCIQPAGEAVGLDKQNNAVFRVHANGIDIGYKLVGSGEPLVMIMGLGGTMAGWPQEAIEAL
ncbi:MAG: hypothetical protein WCT05_01835, partial [Lentisphaeria bacterium]